MIDSSLLEYSQHWGDHPDLLYDISNPKHKTPNEKMLAVARWFLSTLYGSFRSRCENQMEKKPFNPILGETFNCSWKDTNNKGWNQSHINVEQVSHHPPHAAFAVQVPSKREKGKPFVSLQGHCGQKTVFATSAITVTQVGRAQLTVQGDDYEDTYTIFPLPEMSVAGLLSMSAFVELFGKTHITSTTGAIAEIEFIPKGWFSGEYFAIKGFVKESDNAEVYGTFGGKWSEKSTFTIGGKTATLFDAKVDKPHERIVKEISEQLPSESLRLWGECSKAIQDGNYSLASTLKSKIEDEQREKRKLRKETKEIWLPKLFEFVEAAEEEEELGTTVKDPQQTGGVHDKTLGHWVRKSS